MRNELVLAPGRGGQETPVLNVARVKEQCPGLGFAGQHDAVEIVAGQPVDPSRAKRPYPDPAADEALLQVAAREDQPDGVAPWVIVETSVGVAVEKAVNIGAAPAGKPEEVITLQVGFPVVAADDSATKPAAEAKQQPAESGSGSGHRVEGPWKRRYHNRLTAHPVSPGRPSFLESRMSQRIVPGSLVLYKTRPARVTDITDKIEIALSGDKPKRVRDKDIALLHPGPVDSLDSLSVPPGNLDEARELLSGETVPLADLAELLYGDFTPATAWSSWQLVADGLYFTGTPEAVTGRDADAVEADIAEREARVAREVAWGALITRLKQGRMAREDRQELGEVERLALGRIESSRILQALGISETPEHAHRLLSRVGYWDEDHDPYPARFGAPAVSPALDVPGLPVETRLDLTHLPAYAIDDEGNEDPDDALSIDGDRLWVHVADAAVLAPADTEIDREARSRGANLYLPEGVVNMLPEEVTRQLGLGLREISPALSVGMRVADDGSLYDVELRLTTIRARRISYAEADGRLADAPLRDVVELTRRFRARRFANNAASIDLPEAMVRVVDGEVRVRPIETHTSREVVTDAMLMAGEAVARHAMANNVPIPFVGQPVPEEIRQPATLSEMYAYRRLFKPSSSSLGAQPHFGLGLEVYTRATSPLRRYLDLLTHQQLRAHLCGADPLPREELGARIAEADAASATVRKTERFANRHWKLVYLKRRPGWEGEAVVLDLEERRAVVVLPALALEARLRRTADMELDQRLRVAVAQVDLPDLDVRFRVLA